MNPFQNRNNAGIYHVFLTPIEQAHPEITLGFILSLNEVESHDYEIMSRREIYRYALGFMELEEYNQFEFYLDYFEVREKLNPLITMIQMYYQQVIPHEFQNTDCFSLLDITHLSTGLHMYRFTCDVPQELAESKYGVDFEYLRNYFNGDRTS